MTRVFGAQERLRSVPDLSSTRNANNASPPQEWKARILSRLSRAASPGLCIVLDDDPRVLSVARDQGLLAVNARLASVYARLTSASGFPGRIP